MPCCAWVLISGTSRCADRGTLDPKGRLIVAWAVEETHQCTLAPPLKLEVALYTFFNSAVLNPRKAP